jgi:hypothetical protein
VDRGDRGDLLEGEVVADLVSVLCGEKERPAAVTTRSLRVKPGYHDQQADLVCGMTGRS